MNGKIDQSLFSTQRSNQEDKQHCPQCGGVTVIKHSKRGPFKSCSNYPNCNFTQSLSNHDGHIVKHLSVACPDCGEELVLRQGRFGMFIGCSAFPSCLHTEKREHKIEDNFQTKNQCPQCKQGTLTEKQSRFGKTFYACSTYPKCNFAVNNKPIAGKCSQCGYPLLLEKTSATGVVMICGNKKCQANN